MQCAKDFREPTDEMRVSSSCPNTKLFHIKIYPPGKARAKKSFHSEHFTTKHQNIPGQTVASNRAEASVQIMTLSSYSPNRKRNYRRQFRGNEHSRHFKHKIGFFLKAAVYNKCLNQVIFNSPLHFAFLTR